MILSTTKKQKKKVLWNNKVYDSAKELSLSLGLSKSACATAIKRGSKMQGFVPMYVEKLNKEL